MDSEPHFSEPPPARMPVVVMVLIEVGRQRWSVAAIDAAKAVIPLVQSEDGDLARCLIPPFDEQLSFLRHRLCGVLQRANDRLYARQMKAMQVVFVCDRPFETPGNDLTQALADHFVEWLTRPPVALFVDDPDETKRTSLRLLAGELTLLDVESLESCVADLVREAQDAKRWERIPRKP